MSRKESRTMLRTRVGFYAGLYDGPWQSLYEGTMCVRSIASNHKRIIVSLKVCVCGREREKGRR